MATLKPCPFCGDDEGLYPGYRIKPRAGPTAPIVCEDAPYCIDCICCGFEFVPREGLDVITMWNRRAT